LFYLCFATEYVLTRQRKLPGGLGGDHYCGTRSKHEMILVIRLKTTKIVPNAEVCNNSYPTHEDVEIHKRKRHPDDPRTVWPTGERFIFRYYRFDDSLLRVSNLLCRLWSFARTIRFHSI
jgi:hypothetical protein